MPDSPQRQYLTDQEFAQIGQLSPPEFEQLPDDVKSRVRLTARRNFEIRMGDENVESWVSTEGETYREFLDNLLPGSFDLDPPDGSGYR